MPLRVKFIALHVAILDNLIVPMHSENVINIQLRPVLVVFILHLNIVPKAYLNDFGHGRCGLLLEYSLCKYVCIP